jgi:transcriptional regulator with XRE-family HTH domain
MTQTQLARQIGSSQSRVAKMEAADPSVSMELLVRSLAALGASQAEIGKIVGARNRKGKTKSRDMSATMK